MTKKTSLLIAALALIAVLAIPGVATAASPTQDAYSGTAGQQQAGGGGGDDGGVAGDTTPVADVTPVATTSGDTGSLPFTGFEIGIAVIVGIGLLGAGFALRRVGTAGDPA